MIVAILACLAVLLAILYYVYILRRSLLPCIEMNPNGEIAPIISKMKTIKKKYTPTFWLTSANNHTLRGMRNRFKPDYPISRKILTFKDGGNAAIDFFHPENAKKDVPVVIIIHTLLGGTREPCTHNMAVAVAKFGWRAAVANQRGCSGAKFTTGRVFNMLEINDTQETVEYIKKEYNPKNIFIIGFSYGSIQAASYAFQDGGVDAVVSVSHPYTMEECSKNLEKPPASELFNSFLMSKLLHLISKNQFIDPKVKEETLKSTSLREFDDRFTAGTLGLPDRTEYYKKTDIYPMLSQMRTRFLLINSEDDPFTRAELMPINEVKKSTRAAFIHTKEGGHVSFLQGIKGNDSYMEPVILEFLQFCAESINK